MYRLQVDSFVEEQRTSIHVAENDTIEKLVQIANSQYPDFADGENWLCIITDEEGVEAAYRYDNQWSFLQ